jgi:hypothetical protein
MFYKVKANTIKLMINSFANGHIELVKEFHSKFGDSIFDYVPSIGRRGYHERLIFYAFKGNHEKVIEYYLKQKCVKPLSSNEIHKITKSVGHNLKKLTGFLENRSKLYQEFLPLENCIDLIEGNIIQSYNLELIDAYLDKYPEDLEKFISKCSSTAKGIQLRRHLQLKQLINE